jgi:hypothetical protein
MCTQDFWLENFINSHSFKDLGLDMNILLKLSHKNGKKIQESMAGSFSLSAQRNPY